VPQEPSPNTEPKVVRMGTDLMSYSDTELFSAYVPDTGIQTVTESTLPPLTWKGGKLQKDVFRKLLSFMYWVNETYSTEATSRLFYNSQTREWDCAVLPQKICKGLAAKELEASDESNAILSDLLSRGFDTNGSLHSHCNAGAFQSGTDSRDERNDVGFHITVGHLNKPEADLHCRFTNYKIVYGVNKEDWFEGEISEYLTMSDLPEFPQTWKDMMREVPATTVVMGWAQSEFGNYSPYKGSRDFSYYNRWANEHRHAPTLVGNISSSFCKHEYLEGSLDPQHMLLDVYQTVMKSINSGQTPSDLSPEVLPLVEYLVQYCVMAVCTSRILNYLDQPEKASRFNYKNLLSDVESEIDSALDHYNPAYELLAGVSIFDDWQLDARAVKVLTDTNLWTPEFVTLVKTGFFTPAILGSRVLESLYNLPEGVEYGPDGGLLASTYVETQGQTQKSGVQLDEETSETKEQELDAA